MFECHGLEKYAPCSPTSEVSAKFQDNASPEVSTRFEHAIDIETSVKHSLLLSLAAFQALEIVSLTRFKETHLL